MPDKKTSGKDYFRENPIDIAGRRAHCAHMKPEQVIKRLGAQKIADALCKNGDRSQVHHSTAKGYFPARWYAVLSQMMIEAGYKQVPFSLFNFAKKRDK